MMQDAILRKVELIGEAINRLSPTFISTHTELPIHESISIRNILIHEYDDIDLKIIWDTITVDIPQLNRQLRKIIKL
ncbi:MAG TPA: DUF86 domain-containing protein [Candidatus Woesebacteria bacterium]|nr:DUF86 domain-containing protein [Candidatus Woesebacteria bacterium]